MLYTTLNSLCSTWTIDLCYILNHFSIKIKYYTKTLGVNPSFSQEKFYDSYILKVTDLTGNDKNYLIIWVHIQFS